MFDMIETPEIKGESEEVSLIRLVNQALDMGTCRCPRYIESQLVYIFNLLGFEVEIISVTNKYSEIAIVFSIGNVQEWLKTLPPVK